jgi:DNA-directed RNA polymerase specialized sigma24 family protein
LTKKRGLTQECFDRLLDWLAPDDRELAGSRYEELRKRLNRYFISRGSSAPEELADRTFDRVCEKIGEIASTYSGDPAPYIYKVAHNIYLESFREKRASRLVPEPTPEPDIEDVFQCLEKCIAPLPEETRRMVIEYYQKDGMARIENHKAMARRLGIRVEALRLRMHRIRLGLRECVEGCMNQGENR